MGNSIEKFNSEEYAYLRKRTSFSEQESKSIFCDLRNM